MLSTFFCEGNLAKALATFCDGVLLFIGTGLGLGLIGTGLGLITTGGIGLGPLLTGLGLGLISPGSIGTGLGLIGTIGGLLVSFFLFGIALFTFSLVVFFMLLGRIGMFGITAN